MVYINIAREKKADVPMEPNGRAVRSAGTGGGRPRCAAWAMPAADHGSALRADEVGPAGRVAAFAGFPRRFRCLVPLPDARLRVPGKVFLAWRSPVLRRRVVADAADPDVRLHAGPPSCRLSHQGTAG